MIVFFPLFRVVEHGMATGILSARQGSRPRDPIVKSTKLWVCDGARWGTAIRTCTAQGGGRAKGSLPGNLIGCPPRHPRGTSAPGLFGARRQNTLRCARLHVSVHLDLETNGWLPLVGERGEAVSEAYFWSTNGLAGLGCRDSALLTGPPAWSRTNPIGTVHSTEYNLEDSFWLM